MADSKKIASSIQRGTRRVRTDLMSIVDQKTLQTPTFLQAMLRTLTINLRFHQESMSLNLSHTLTGYLTKRITGALTLEYG